MPDTSASVQRLYAAAALHLQPLAFYSQDARKGFWETPSGAAVEEEEQRIGINLGGCQTVLNAFTAPPKEKARYRGRPRP
ncbi:hypothetical protein SKAU_G00429360 [Synaphobranchus kaupii]|uniref:Uncharacterized protein n=1 Tax=Synaphobranchus kaupii TaxID=118154 RepID=A0A9Q1E4F7_SYNKA|nr:hypothetical protein SKAU_G00429360 [Synaphobranchus kaupii]